MTNHGEPETPTDAPAIDSARRELAHLVDRRARRKSYASAAGLLATGGALLLGPIVTPGTAVLIAGLSGGLAMIITGLLIGLGVIRLTGERSRYQHDRIAYLQAYVAAQAATAAMPVRARSSRRRPKSRPMLAPTVETLPPTVDTLERF